MLVEIELTGSPRSDDLGSTDTGATPQSGIEGRIGRGDDFITVHLEDD